MFYPYLYDLLVNERLADARREAALDRMLHEGRPPLRQRAALALGGLLIALGKRLARPVLVAQEHDEPRGALL
jgi:hypothetical protein